MLLVACSARPPESPLAAALTTNSVVRFGGSAVTALLRALTPAGSAPAPTPLAVDDLVVQATADGATITWTTNVPATSRVEYGTTAAYGQTANDAAPMLGHTVTLTGLGAGAYHVRAGSVDAQGRQAQSSDATFAVAAKPSGNQHRFCGWVLANGRDDAASDPGYVSFAQHAEEMDAIHPVWWHLGTATTFKSIYGMDSPVITDHTTRNGKRVRLIPTVAAVDDSEPAWVSGMIKDANQRAQHIASLVALAKDHGYDGLDLDYEHLPASDRAAFSQFAVELGSALHAAGKELSFAVEPNTGSGPHDWVALSAAADHLHVMGYDYHFYGSHLGPTSPLGWVQDLANYARSIDGGKRAQKFILGVANYGLAGSEGGSSSWFGNSVESAALAGADYATTTNHMNVCAYGSQAAGRSPNVMTSRGRLYFEDVLSLEEKVQVAQTAGLGGITYWSMGGEPSMAGRTFFQMVRSHFAQ